MKTLLRHIKLMFRLCYRLVCWINYPTSRERMWGMFELGKVQGRKEALKELPIVQVQPRQTAKITEVHLPPGEWTRLYREAHGLHKIALVSPQDDSWLNSKPPISIEHMTPEQIATVPTIRDLDPLNTDEYPAVVKLLHQNREQRRHAG